MTSGTYFCTLKAVDCVHTADDYLEVEQDVSSTGPTTEECELTSRNRPMMVHTVGISTH